MTGNFMADNSANMQHHQDCQNNAGNIVDLFENSDECDIFNRGRDQEKAKWIDGPVHHHDSGCQYEAGHQINNFMNPKSRPLRECSVNLSPRKKRKKNPDNKKRNKQRRDRHIKRTYSFFKHWRSIQKGHIKATDQRPQNNDG